MLDQRLVWPSGVISIRPDGLLDQRLLSSSGLISIPIDVGG
jgi:hypothetical protein